MLLLMMHVHTPVDLALPLRNLANLPLFLDIWVGNTSDQDIRIVPGELFGFGTGQFEEVTKGRCLIAVSFQVLFSFLFCCFLNSDLSFMQTYERF